MSFEKWWNSLGQPGPVARKVKSEAYECQSPFAAYSCYGKSKEQIEQEQEDLRLKITSCLLEDRKTVNRIEFNEQVEKVINAAKAVANLESAKIDKGTPVSYLTFNVFHEEVAKLRLLAFEPSNISADSAKVIFDAILNDRKSEK